MIKVDKDTCVSCGACVSTCPTNFAIGSDNKAEPVSQDDNSCVSDAVKVCPVNAIEKE